MTCGNDREIDLPSTERGPVLGGCVTFLSHRRRAGRPPYLCSLGPRSRDAANPIRLRGPGVRPAPFSFLRRATAICILALVALVSGISPALAERTPAPKDAELYIIWPSDGAVIEGGKLWVRMGLRNMGVSPKGVHMPNVGHHHLLIDTELGSMDEPIPSDRNHLHFGAGETEARIELPPGKHTLQLLLGDDNHVPHNPPVFSKKITITVR
jgi:hypothetical protein